MQQASAALTPDSIASIAGRDVRRRRAADHEVSRMTCLPNNVVFRTLRREPARGGLPAASLARVWLALAICTAATVAGSHAREASSRKERAAAPSTVSRPGGAPIMAIVSLRSQGITVYDTTRWIMRAPVSSGQSGRETPAGVFSVLQKDADHRSNLYDDAWMPHMHRLTWSGIALHGGPHPGHAASHGCVRLPYDFASRLFDVTKVGMRVIISPGDVAPVEIAHPALPQSKPVSADVAAARATEAADAARKADQAKRAADVAYWAAAQAAAPVSAAETLKQKAEALLAAADREAAKAQAAEAKAAGAAEDAKAKATEAKLTVERANANAAEAKLTVERANDNAAEAKQTAERANAKVAEAKLTTERAKAKVAEAKLTAERANAKAAEAKLKAADANAKVAEAKPTAEHVNAKAAEAMLTAEDANAKAAEAKMTADEVKAAEALLTAEELNAKAAEAKVKAEEANAKAAEAMLTAEEANAKAAGARLMAEEANAKAAEAKLKTEETNAKAAEAKLKTEEANAKAAKAKLETEEANAKMAKAKAEAVQTMAGAAEEAYAKAVEARHKVDDAKARAAEDLADEVAKLTGAKTDQQAKVDAAEAVRKVSAEAEARRTETAEAASDAARKLEPASVFISRKTQRLYVRQAFEPVLEVPVTIQDPGRLIGTYVFTATGSIDDTADLRWTVVSLKGRDGNSRVAAASDVLDAEPPPADASGAKAALDRIAIPADVADRIAGMISPRSSVIVSDEALSPETGKGTEFVVIMNDEP
jgi:hypothetical protein